MNIFYTDHDPARAAVMFENYVLSADPEFLTAAAIAVRSGGAPTPEYWAFLASQVEECTADPDGAHAPRGTP